MLAVSSMVAVVGLSAVMISRANIRANTAARDWSSAGVAAQAGIDYAVAVMNSSSTWRTDATNLVPIGPVAIGSAKVLITINDEIDGNLADDPTEPVRVYSVATIGAATRAYSALVSPISSTGYDVLRCPLACASSLSITANCTVSSGPLSSNADTNNTASPITDLETSTLSSSGYINGFVKTGVAAKTMPGTSAWTTLSATATTISYASISGGTMDKNLLTTNVNPWGSKNTKGIYAITVPAASTLTIRRSRLIATLLVTLGAGSSLVLQDECLWDPGQSTQPALIVQGTVTSAVTLGGSGGGLSLSEPSLGVNFNPNGSPYNNQTDNDMLDTYPCEIHGLFHVISATPVTVTSNLKLVGCIVTAGAATINTAATLTANPTLISNPPTGYTDPANGKMQPTAGTFRWEVADVNN